MLTYGNENLLFLLFTKRSLSYSFWALTWTSVQSKMCVLNNMDAIVPHRRNDKPENLAIGSQRPKQQLLELVFEKAGVRVKAPSFAKV